MVQRKEYDGNVIKIMNGLYLQIIEQIKILAVHTVLIKKYWKAIMI